MTNQDDDDRLVDRVLDCIAASRKTIRVAEMKQPEAAAGHTTYFASFLISIDDSTHKRLREVAKAQSRAIPKLLQRYTQLAFRFIAEEEQDEEPEQKAAA
jgi:hypothetical protein